MAHVLRRHIRTGITVALALVLVGIAGVAAAAETCIELNTTPSVLYRLVVTQPSPTTASVVGTITRGAVTGVVTGAGALIGGAFEVTLQASDIRVSFAVGDDALTTTTTHLQLNGPAFTSGPFQAAFVGYFESGHGSGQLTALEEGTATVVACPPLQ